MIKKFSIYFLFIFFLSNIANAETIKVDVNGLVCEFCAVTIEKNFRKKSSVASVNVDLESKKVTINVKEGSHISDQDVRDTIVNNGYNVVNIARNQ